MSEKLTRSQFLTKALGLASRHASRILEEKLEAVLPSGVRPPWSLETSSFLAICEKCGACGEICPKGVVYYHSRDNRVFAGTPYLDFTKSFCDFCGECVKVCPSAALSFEKGVKELGVAGITGKLCLIATDDCAGHCLDSCPEAAIAIDLSGRPDVDADLCNGCGACVATCKGSAIKIG